MYGIQIIGTLLIPFTSIVAEHADLSVTSVSNIPKGFLWPDKGLRRRCLEFLLKAGVDVKARGFGQTSLHFAASQGHLELARLLLEQGADINAATLARGETPLAVAVRAKKEKMAEFLRQRGGRA